MSPLRTRRWTWAALLGSAAFLAVMAVTAVRQRGGQEMLAQLPAGQCYADKPPACTTSCPNGVEMDLGNACYCAGPCTDHSGNPGTCGAGTCGTSCIAAGNNCATTNLPCCTGLSCNTGAGSNATCVSSSCLQEGDPCPTGGGCCSGLQCVVPDPSVPAYKACQSVSTTCGNGVIDTGEACDGGACCSAVCTFEPSGTQCRAAAGACDAEEKCTGGSATCPNDTKAAAGAVCRAAVGTCDLAENCTGSSHQCPADGFRPGTFVCDTDNNKCCTGTNTQCTAACPTSSAASSVSSVPPSSSSASSPLSSTSSTSSAPSTSSVSSASSPPPPSSSASSAQAVYCCVADKCQRKLPISMCSDNETYTNDTCDEKCGKASSAASSTSSAPSSASSVSLVSSVASSMSSAQSSDGRKRVLVTCGGLEEFPAEKLADMGPSDVSTVVATKPADGGAGIRRSILHCSDGGRGAAGEVTGFCLQNGKCSETPEDANQCAENESTVFFDLGDCERIEESFGKL